MARILIVEDDEDLAERVETWLEHEGHELVIVHNGEDAIPKLSDKTFELMIFDWDLPGKLKGIDLCKHYRTSGGTSSVLMMTGRSQIDDKSQCFDSGADDYLTKPFHLKELSMRVKALVRRNAPAAAPATEPEPEPPRKEVYYKRCELCAASYSMSVELCENDGAPLITELLDPLIGTTFGERYEIEEVLGSGGMSIVYKANHTLMHKKVAIKLLSEEMTKMESAIKRFQYEAQAISRLSHQNVVVVHDFGMTRGKQPQPFMVMDYLNGEPLDSILDREGQLPLARALDILIQACRGLAHAHDKGIVHRDVKPGNLVILQGAEGKDLVKLVDFGISLVRPEGSQAQEKLTRRGESFGTCDYMSPEFCRGKDIDGRSDMYSFGCMMFECFTGVCPFEGENYLDTLQKHISEETPWIKDVRPDLRIPTEVERIMRKTLEKKPEDRYRSMHELERELERVRALVCP